MPKPTSMALRWVLATAAALVAGAAWCPAAGAVVGGHDITSIAQAPYQVGIVIRTQTPYNGLWCGGVYRDPQHIITAAHCVFDNTLGSSGQPVPPGAIDVYAGSRDLTATSGYSRIPVKAVSLDDDYDPATFSHDAAVLTLDGNLQPIPNAIEPIALVDDLTWQTAGPTTLATVTGWGEKQSNNPHSYPAILQTAQVPIVGDTDCAPAYPGFSASVMTCAGDALHDACFGDSGGPLVVHDDLGDDRLLGIVSFGPSSGCAVAGYPGGYTEVHDQAVMDYLDEPDPVSAPRTLVSPSVQGEVAVGRTVACNPGAWDGGPNFTYQFVVPTSSGDVARTARTSQNSYTIQPGDAGATLRCDVKGTNDGGLAFAKSATVTVPVPESNPPQPTPPQPSPPQQPSQQDSAAPVARVTKTTCTSTRCTLTVSVTDAGFSAGIQTVKASVKSTYRTTCTRKGTKKKVACTKTKSGRTSVSTLAATRFKVVASKLPIGKQVFTLVAVDKAGHRQALPTTKTVTTKKPKKRR
jgi:Trypsin